jgi:hypothetical protein
MNSGASGSFQLNLTVARQLTCRVFRVQSPASELPGYRYFLMEPSTRRNLGSSTFRLQPRTLKRELQTRHPNEIEEKA